MDDLRAKRKAEGKCVQCGAELDREGICCTRCNDMNNESKSIGRYFMQKAGKCVNCGKALDRVGMFCKKCLKKSNKKAMIRNAERRLQGLCVQCGEIAEGYSYCQRCRDQRMDRYKKKNH